MSDMSFFDPIVMVCHCPGGCPLFTLVYNNSHMFYDLSNNENIYLGGEYIEQDM